MSIPKEVSEGIVVKKDGVYRYHWYDGQKTEKVDSLVKWLRMPLYFDDDITFEDFFKHIMNEHELVSLIFHSHLGGYSLEHWLEEWNKPDLGDKKYDHEKIDSVELHWAVEYHEKNPEYGVEEWVGFHGKGLIKDEMSYGDDEWHETSFGFSFTPLNEYKHYPFKINEEWKLYNWDAPINNDMTDEERDKLWYLYAGTKSMTVYDVIGALLFDISFYGSPESRQERADELTDTVQRIKDGTEEMSSYDNVEDLIDSLKGNSDE